MIIKDSEGNDSEAEDLNFRETLPSSSKKNTPRSKVFENEVNSEKVKPSLRNFPRNDYEDVFEEPSESGSDPSMWTARGPFRRDRWSSENEEPAGPSQALSPLLSDMHKIVSEGELHQLAQIRPLIFNFHEQTAIKDCLKMLEKKTGAYDIMQEFMFNIMDIVAQMREQRSGMVQTKEQYHFCYDIVLKVLRKLLTLD
ncbi:tyrosine-protein phosphatase non-receptor type 20 isoform X7 [Piliocolobus tephrosceles]|uniref:tyrosine-protein phosphatase non-receptor type 20 isoform X7 n=1 Tax=Piliocolobus tephrosceles TaxID=591936 RepID=UPI000E6B4DDD|nr:tyrosine-protein phosphatase non-receptor type 20 isoform X7 [Piliocolobus tephrosceles]